MNLDSDRINSLSPSQRKAVAELTRSLSLWRWLRKSRTTSTGTPWTGCVKGSSIQLPAIRFDSGHSPAQSILPRNRLH